MSGKRITTLALTGAVKAAGIAAATPSASQGVGFGEGSWRGSLSYNALVIFDDDIAAHYYGTPYWAWSGSETAVYVGGFDDADAVGPWVHEPMTWTVAATDAEGIPIAISEPGVLTPSRPSLFGPQTTRESPLRQDP